MHLPNNFFMMKFLLQPAALIGIKGRQYGPIKPCNALPMSDDETYSYLPMLSDFFKDIRKNIQTEATRQTKQVVRDLIDNVKVGMIFEINAD